MSQTLAKLNANLDTKYSPASGPSGSPIELLRQLEVRLPHQAVTPYSANCPACLFGPHFSPPRFLVMPQTLGKL